MHKGMTIDPFESPIAQKHSTPTARPCRPIVSDAFWQLSDGLMVSLTGNTAGYSMRLVYRFDLRSSVNRVQLGSSMRRQTIMLAKGHALSDVSDSFLNHSGQEFGR